MEKRKFPRQMCAVDAVLSLAEGDSHHCLISEYSQGGLQITFDAAIAGGIINNLHQLVAQQGKASVSFRQANQHLRLPVSIVHITPQGVGLRLHNPDPSIYRVLQHLSAAQADSNSGSSSLTHQQPLLSNRHRKTLMQAACTVLHNYLRSQYSGFCQQLEQALFTGADQQSSTAAQQQFLIAIRQFRKERQSIFAALSRSMIAEAMVVSKGNANAQQHSAGIERKRASPLELVTKNDFEDWLLVRVAISKVELKLREALIELQIRVDAAFGQRDGKRTYNPFSPAALCNSFFDQIRHLQLPYAQLEVVYSVLQKTLLTDLDGFYQQLNQVFIDADILPSIDVNQYLAEQALQKRPPAPPAQVDPAPGASAAAPSAAEKAPSEAGSSSQPLPRSSASNTANPSASAYGTVTQLMGLRRQARGESNRSGSAVSGEPQATAQQLGHLQQSLLDGSVQLLKPGALKELMQQAKGATTGLSDQEHDAADTIEGLFDSILQSDRISNELREEFSKLQVPLLRAMLQDPEIFSAEGHPARQALNYIALLSDRSSTNLAANTPVILDAIRSILGDKSEGGGFSQSIDKLDQLVSREKRLIERNLQRIRQGCEGQQRLRHANRQIQHELGRMLAEPAPQPVIALIEHGWRDLMRLSYLREGVASRSWEITLQVVEQLVAQHDPARLSGLERTLSNSDLLRLLEKGLSKVPEGQHSHRLLLQQLEGMLQAAPEDLSLVSYRPGDTAESNLQEKLDALADQDQTLMRWVKRARDLRTAQWFELSHGKLQEKLVQLAWIADDDSLYVFANHQGTQKLELPLERVATLLRDGNLVLLSDAALPAVEQGLDALVQKVYDKLAFDSCHDPLTGFLTRKEFCRLLAQKVAATDAAEAHYSLIFIDIMQFKIINNTCGYEAGDTFLRELAQRLKNFAPADTLVGRMGADQFAIVLNEEAETLGYNSARELKAMIESKRFAYEEHSFVINTALALAGFSHGNQKIMELLRSVEAATSLSKNTGYKDVQVVRPGDQRLEKLDEIMGWVNRINKALDNDNLRLRCQQITPINGSARTLPHYEVLLSVLDEHGEASPPAEFIRVAEEYNRMAAVDRWVVEHVLQWMHENLDDLHLFGGFSVNLSGHSMNDETFLDFIFDALVRYPVPRDKLVFEITETVAVTNLDDAADFIKEMRSIGCRFSLDDFGVGQSSYSYLKRLPVDFIKIDGNFVRDINNNDVDYALVKSITEMGHYLKKKVIAEYVGSEDILNTVTHLGVDYAQGYHFGAPLMLDQFDLSRQP
ncbi:diguanylate cyclase (GGDEF) domain-containing protein [Halopseudomonas sabulinigri]|uniref:Diguanylate cyclase (GGDEF) domain-containing protein n=1 Tax=Halopseudomonas sabulinigri TaxID=472181 RepID=A0A1H1RJZ4_9GAMM|nr:DUF1631 family protein [Halopseudomonas sabulinigri]SDS36064.1 diguanylate cyclase (GGDEF) domain-containing protein [Halopseudomonas sabulinigri]